MITYTLVILMSISGSQSAGLSSTVIPGFTTELACENAKNKIDIGSSLNDYKRVNVVKYCVANHI